MVLGPAHLLEFVIQNFDLFLVLVLFFWVLWGETNCISEMSPNWWINDRRTLSALDSGCKCISSFSRGEVTGICCLGLAVIYGASRDGPDQTKHRHVWLKVSLARRHTPPKEWRDDVNWTCIRQVLSCSADNLCRGATGAIFLSRKSTIDAQSERRPLCENMF